MSFKDLSKFQDSPIKTKKSEKKGERNNTVEAAEQSEDDSVAASDTNESISTE